ncbi:tape measure protein [Acinetobacter seifertii]|uniref:tape measure protein n=1 Tax=Acinetobacter seifertii TaxID=1530123 RepID=UPI003BDF82DF
MSDINNEILAEAIELFMRGRGGKFTRDEWNVLLENAPLIAREVAKKFDLTTGQFRQYIGDGLELKFLTGVIVEGSAHKLVAEFSVSCHKAFTKS